VSPGIVGSLNPGLMERWQTRSWECLCLREQPLEKPSKGCISGIALS
jgi:hypothetical protein